MLFKNLMEDKRSNLNLNQPLLSVRTRRNSSPSLYTQKDEKRKTSTSLPIVPHPPPYRSELQSGPIRNPGAVPFLWEHIPGRPKEDINPHTQNHNKPPIVPKLPPSRYTKANETKSATINIPRDSDERIKNIESRKDATEEIESSNSEDTDDAFVDALDTLSRTESHFINCSMSGLSGIDDLDTKPSGSLKDPKTRDFMMNRFLPAAKAMVIETPHTAPKKQPVVQERTQVKKIDNQVKPSLRYGPSFAKRYSHYNNDDEEEESDDEYDRRRNLPGVCGLWPRFCLKSSVCILNPVPVMSVRTRVSMSPASKIKPRSSSTGSYSTSENESKSDISELQSIDKSRAAEFEEKTSLRNESGQSENASTYRDAPPVPYRDVISEEKKHVDKVFESDGKCIKTFQDFLADPEELDSGGVALEKTVYVDTIHKVESPKSFRSPRLSGDDSKLSTKIMDQIHVKDLKKIDSLDGELKPLVNAQEFVDFQKLGMEMQKSFGEDEDSNFASTVTENKKDSTRSIENKKMSEYLVPPPLPKSPSDSWLGRTLPSMSAKKCSFLGATTNPQNQFSKASTGDSKWEAIVKTTNVQRQHMRYSEEHLTPIPET